MLQILRGDADWLASSETGLPAPLGSNASPQIPSPYPTPPHRYRAVASPATALPLVWQWASRRVGQYAASFLTPGQRSGSNDTDDRSQDGLARRGRIAPPALSTGSCYHRIMDGIDGIALAHEVAARVVPIYRPLGGLSFVYGQGSLVAGFATDADLDLILVWDRPEPPPAVERPIDLLHTGTSPSAQFDRPNFFLDQFWMERQQVDVLHVPRSIFDGWLSSIGTGGGWEHRAYPQPLAAVAGFAYGVLLADIGGEGTRAREAVNAFPQALVDRSREHVAAHLPSYADVLAGCAARGDGWLFHEILGDALRPVLVAWFSAHHRYLPFHKRLHHWIARFALDPAIADLERRLWLPEADLVRKQALYSTLAAHILALPSAP